MQHNLRSVMRHFATGVCVVSTYSDTPDGRRHDAVTVNSLTSLSLTPPLVSFSLWAGSRFLADLLAAKVFGVSILDADGEQHAHAFARDRDARADAVQAIGAVPGQRTGALVLDAPSWMECEYRDQLQAGDHVLVVGEVVSLGVSEPRPPLIFVQGGFHTLEVL